ncbi:MAG: selenide, water dikinase SelD [Anaerolineaceae bacterium]|nr:selenide, water dikinase SelD [Anaerolineaceae bacterium]
MRPINNVFKPGDYPDLLVGMTEPDDASIWQLDEKRALVVTTDFFTPIVDDPFSYGAIAAANSLSDIYAMGGKPFMALNVAAFPPDLPKEILAEIIRGGAVKAHEAGVVIAGGHTVQDKEPKYGLIVLGFVDTQSILRKGGACPGDRLVLTKPLGFGVIASAIRAQKATLEDIDEVTDWMMRLNEKYAQVAVALNLRGATDITGFSLLGHGWEMAQASGAGMRLTFERIPLLDSAVRYAEMGIFPGGAFDNKNYYADNIRIAADIREAEEMLLYDPQTSGGLLLSVPPEKLDAFFQKAEKIGQPVWEIGVVIEEKIIEVV